MEDKKGKELVSELQEPGAKVDPTVPSDMKGLWLQLGGSVAVREEEEEEEEQHREIRKVGETTLEREVAMKMGSAMENREGE